jgi:hypothetical protein
MKNNLVKRLAPIVAAGAVSLAALAGCESPPIPTTGTINVDFPQGPYNFPVSIYAKDKADNNTEKVGLVNSGQASYSFELSPSDYDIYGEGVGISGAGSSGSFVYYSSNTENISVNAGESYSIDLILN